MKSALLALGGIGVMMAISRLGKVKYYTTSTGEQIPIVPYFTIKGQPLTPDQTQALADTLAGLGYDTIHAAGGVI